MYPPARLLILAGGQSEEHEVSLLSARGVAEAAREAGYRVRLQLLARDGRLVDPARNDASASAGAVATGDASLAALADAVADVDCVFPVLHGPHGEDGTLQGLLELLGVPYVGAGTLSSALCMDKPMAKEVLRAGGVPQVDYVTLTRATLQSSRAQSLRYVQERLPGPWFVKPANMGSSVGVGKARDASQLEAALDAALRLDRRAIVEAAVHPVRELEVAVLGNDRPEASPVGEITYVGEFYDYATKYTEGRARMVVPSEVEARVASELQALALTVFRLLDCAGLARVDFFYAEQEGKVYVNEVNTLPGFTKFSMYPSMWQAAGVSFPQLVRRLVDLAHERHPRPAM